MLMIAPHIDAAVLVSGDGRLCPTGGSGSVKGVRVEVVGLAEMTAMALIDVADTFTELSELVPVIQMRYRPTAHAELPLKTVCRQHSHPPLPLPTSLTTPGQGHRRRQ